MSSEELPTFDTKDRQRVYEYIREHGPLSPQELEDEGLVPVTPERYWQIVAILKRDGYITESEGKLRDAFRAQQREEYSEDDLEFTVRQAQTEDLSGLAGVIRQVTAGETYLVGESVEDQLSNAAALLEGDPEETPAYFVALVEDEVIGWASLVESGEKLPHVVYLTMGLLDEYRGLGIGSALLDQTLSWAGKHGYRKASSNVPATNPDAIDFLVQNEWDEVARRPEHYEIGGQYVDEVLLDRWI
jgi:GNAT superfamily N-acetyltransferase